MQAPGVLIVEHEDRVSRVLCRIVERMGYTPFPAADYINFKKLYIERQPEIILLSLEVPGNDNAEFCRYLVEQQSQAAIILLSDMEESETSSILQLGLSAGLKLNGVLRKPVDVESVKELLAGLDLPAQPSALKKSHKFGRLLRPKDQAQAMILDPDHRLERRFCIKCDPNYLINNRKPVSHTILQGVIP